MELFAGILIGIAFTLVITTLVSKGERIMPLVADLTAALNNASASVQALNTTIQQAVVLIPNAVSASDAQTLVTAAQAVADGVKSANDTLAAALSAPAAPTP